MFRGGAAKLMQHGLAPVEGQMKEEEKVSKGEVGGRKEERRTELEGQHVIQLLLAAAACLPCFHIPPYVHS